LQWEKARLARVAGENDMPALFGYLVALVLLLGGGYGGLQWLASPDDVSIHQRIGEKPAAKNVPRKSEQSEKTEQSEKSEFNAAKTTAVPGEADAASGIGTTASAPAAMAAPQQSDHEGNETETVAKSGDKTGDPASGVNSNTADAARKDDAAAASGTSTLNSEPAPRPGKPAAASAESSQDAKQKGNAQHKDDAQVKDIASTPRQSEPRFEPGVNPAKQDRRQAKRQERPHVRSSRSRLVMMYLRTIEFPDGHQEQQLLPIRRARRMAIEADDQW
jgi:hypothetical protein